MAVAGLVEASGVAVRVNPIFCCLPITTFQATSIDRLHGHRSLAFGDYDTDSAIALRYRRSGAVDNPSSGVNLEWSIYPTEKHC